MIRNARIKYVGQYESCMVDQLQIILERTRRSYQISSSPEFHRLYAALQVEHGIFNLLDGRTEANAVGWYQLHVNSSQRRSSMRRMSASKQAYKHRDHITPPSSQAIYSSTMVHSSYTPPEQLATTPATSHVRNSAPTGACTINRPCAQQFVGKYQSCMVISGRLIVHAPIPTYLPSSVKRSFCRGQG